MANKSSGWDFMVASAMALGLGTLLSIGAVIGINQYLGPEEDPFVPYTSSIHNSPDPDWLDNLKSSNGDVISKRPWTIKDDDQLRVLAATGETSGSIAVRLKRSAAAIRKRAIYLGIVLAGSTKALGLKAKKS